MSAGLEQLAAALGEPGGVSGAELARRFELTRAAVWKRVEQLRALGLEVEAAAGRGYRLAQPVEWLDAARIGPGCETYFQIDSTSNELLRRGATAASGTVVFAEAQSAGRGRRGRAWRSPLGANLMFSVLWRFDAGFAALAGLSLAVGVALAEALEGVGVPRVMLKWPNDLQVDGRKLGGILVEVSGEASGPCAAVIGVGINGRMSELAGAGIDQPWIDLARAAPSELPGRNAIAAALLGALLPALARFEREGLAPFRDAFASRDALARRPVRVHAADGAWDGVAEGVDASGQLLVRDAAGALRAVGSGEVSVRARA